MQRLTGGWPEELLETGGRLEILLGARMSYSSGWNTRKSVAVVPVGSFV